MISGRVLDGSGGVRLLVEGLVELWVSDCWANSEWERWKERRKKNKEKKRKHVFYMGNGFRLT